MKSSRISQIVFLALFLVLFLMTEYRGRDDISAAVNAFFRADPLTSVSAILATKRFEWLLLPGVVVLVFTAGLGRFFCGWICPLGTVLDLVTGKIRKTAPIRALQGNVKYWLLVPLLVASLFNLNVSGLLDPMAILVRALTFVVHPLAGETVRSGWKELYGLIGDRRDLLAPGYSLFRDYLLPFRETLYPLAFLSAFLFLVILFLERYERRNWCRNLCPLGTLLGMAARFSPFSRLPAGTCYCCRGCTDGCPGGFSRDIFQSERCFRCLHCSIVCSSGRARFTARQAQPLPAMMERRVFLGGILSGFLLAKVFRFRDPKAQASLLRPPGVRDEAEFLKKCVRCGECMKVCLRSALYPAFLQAGAEGMYTPLLIPRLGYCEYNCTLCGQVCPTGAIPNLTPEKKKQEVIGKAVINKNRCIPFVQRSDCIVCEEHCPIPQKAIRTESVEEKTVDGRVVVIKKPYVVEELCNGCGICENVCPLEGSSGIDVVAVKDRTPLRPVRPATFEDPYS